MSLSLAPPTENTVSVDISTLLWPLINNVLNMEFDELKDSIEFRHMKQCVSHEVVLKVHIETAAVSPALLDMNSDDVYFICPYIYFRDVNILFSALLNLYKRSGNVACERLLSNAYDKMQEHIQMEDLQETMETLSCTP